MGTLLSRSGLWTLGHAWVVRNGRSLFKFVRWLQKASLKGNPPQHVFMKFRFGEVFVLSTLHYGNFAYIFSLKNVWKCSMPPWLQKFVALVVFVPSHPLNIFTWNIGCKDLHVWRKHVEKPFLQLLGMTCGIRFESVPPFLRALLGRYYWSTLCSFLPQVFCSQTRKPPPKLTLANSLETCWLNQFFFLLGWHFFGGSKTHASFTERVFRGLRWDFNECKLLHPLDQHPTPGLFHF